MRYFCRSLKMQDTPTESSPSSLGCLGDIQHFKEALCSRVVKHFGGMSLQVARACVTNCMGASWSWFCDILTAFSRDLSIPLTPAVSVEQRIALPPPQPRITHRSSHLSPIVLKKMGREAQCSVLSYILPRMSKEGLTERNQTLSLEAAYRPSG